MIRKVLESLLQRREHSSYASILWKSHRTSKTSGDAFYKAYLKNSVSLTTHNWQNENVHSLYVPAIRFVGKKQLV